MKKVQKLFVVMFFLMLGISFLTNCAAPTPNTPAAPVPTATPVPPKAINGTITSANINGQMIFGDTTYGTLILMASGCVAGSLSPEDVWVFDVPSAPKTFTFNSCTVSTAATFEPALYILNSSNTEVACTFHNCGALATLQYAVTATGRYYFVIDGFNGTYGTYGVTITSP